MRNLLEWHHFSNFSLGLKPALQTGGVEFERRGYLGGRDSLMADAVEHAVELHGVGSSVLELDS